MPPYCAATFAQLDQLFGLGVMSRRINESGGNAESAVLHGFGDQRLHFFEFGGCGSTVDFSQYCFAYLSGADIRADIEWRARIFPDAGNNRREWSSPLLICNGQERAAAERGSASVCGEIDPPSPVISVVIPCDSLLSERLSMSKRDFRLPQHVDEPRGNHQALGINHALGVGVSQISDRRDAVAANRDVSRDPRDFRIRR